MSQKVIHVDEWDRRYAVQDVIDRLIEFGPEYLEKLGKFNKDFPVKNHKILEHECN